MTKLVGEDIEAFTCWICTMNSTDKPNMMRYKPSGKPRGWKFMGEFVDKDGTVYHRGEEQPALKGTLPPTKVDKNKSKAKKKKKKLPIYKDPIIKDYIERKKKALKKED